MTTSNPFWEALFGRSAPVEIEIGPERGTFLLAAAAAHPERNYLGIERSSTRVRHIERALEAAPLPNVRVVCGDAAVVVAACVPPESVSAYHIYFPDPWWKRRHQRRRLLTPAVAASLADTLLRGGVLRLLTDVEELFRYAMKSLGSEPRLRELLDAPLVPIRTTFEKKAVARGARLYGISLVKD